jgi:hypothetical protein
MGSHAMPGRPTPLITFRGGMSAKPADLILVSDIHNENLDLEEIAKIRNSAHNKEGRETI